VSTHARSVLVVAAPAALPADIEASLCGHGYFSETVPSGAEALSLAAALPFDVVVVALDGLDTGFREFVRGIRRPDAASRLTVLVALAGGPAAGSARELLGSGVNRVLDPTAGVAALVRAVVELVEAPPRVLVKSVIRFRVRTGKDEKIAMCQTEDISSTGVFVRTEMAVQQGAQVRFEVALPGLVEPIRGTAEIARQIGGGRDRPPGLGLRFLELDGNGADRLHNWLASRVGGPR
jgi:uncharacterized protein (TIGR02266 family)